jgi:hypothetical protein
VCQRTLDVPSHPQGATDIAARHAEIRLQPQRFTEPGNGLISLAPSHKHHAEIVGRLGRVGLEVQSCVAALGRALELAQSAIDFGQVGVVDGIARVLRNGPADILGRTPQFSLLECNHAQEMQGVGMLGLVSQDIAVHLRGLGQTAALVLLNSELEVTTHD